MAVQVRLDLADAVSIKDLRTFLNCMPQNVDATKDLRYQYVDEDKLAYLAIVFPSAPQHSAAISSSLTE